MTDLVDQEEIERIVGRIRDFHFHWGRAVSETKTFYILHSSKCLDTTSDLRDCRFSVALDNHVQVHPDDVDRLLMLWVDNGTLVGIAAHENPVE